MKKSNLLIVFITIILFSACANKEYYEIADLRDIPQDTGSFIGEFNPINEKTLKILDKEFNEKYFRPWDQKNISFSKEEAQWGFYYKDKEMYGLNKRMLGEKWFDKHIENSDFEKFDSLKEKGITVRNTDIRLFPTQKPMFLDPEIAGEGFPFDYNQISALKINTPLYISHYSKDRAWVYAESNFAAGWLMVKDIAFVNKSIIRRYKRSKLAVAIKDNFPVYKKNIFKEYIKLGTIFPVNGNRYMLIEKNINQKAVPYYVKSNYIVKKPIKFDKSNIEMISSEFMDEPYGWGGLLQTRDCSSMTRDFFIPFGIYLNRNSYAQTKNGRYLSLEEYGEKKKKELISKDAKAFRTLLYLKGHIMLYIGEYKNEPLVLHQSWGVRTKSLNGDEGRQIIGRTAITTLEAGKELNNFDKDASLIKRIKGMVIIGG